MISRGRYNLFADDRSERRKYSSRAVELVGRSMVIDMLGLLTLDWPKLYAWQRDPDAFGASDLQKLRASGVRVFHPAVDPDDPSPYQAALGWLEGWNRLLNRRADSFVRIGGATDFDRSRSSRKVGILVGFH